MEWQLSPSVMAEAGTALCILIVAVYFPWRDISRRASLVGSMILIIAALWIFTHSMEIAIPIASYKAYLMGLQLIWGLLALTLWFMYIAYYTATGKWQPGRIYALFGIMPLLAILAVATNSIFGLVWTDPGLDIHNPYLPLKPAYGLVYWACMVYMGALIASGSFLIIKKIVRQHNFRRWEPWVLILAVFLPLLAAFLEVTGVILPAGLTVGITPFFSGIGSILLVWTLPRFHLREVIPVAQHTVFEHIGDCVVVLDMQNRVMDLNPAAERLAGCTSSEALGLAVEQIWPNWPNQFVPTKEPATVVYEELALTCAGELRIYNLRIYTITDHRKSPLNKVALLVDTTERKRVEKDLQDSEEKYRTLVNNVRLGIYRSVSEHGGHFIQVNPAMERITGYSREELLGMHIEDLYVDPAERERALEIWASGSGTNITVVWKRKDSTQINVQLSANALKDTSGNILFYDAVLEDITERKHTEKALRESEEKYAKAFLTSPYAITITSTEDGKFIEVNDAFTSISGFTREEATADSSIGLKLWVNVEDRKRVLSTLLEGNEVKGQEFQFRIKNGEIISGLFSAKIIRLNDKPFILSSINDITERKRAEQKLVEQALELERSNQELQQFAYILTHDLQEPLRMVSSYVRLLEKRYKDKLDSDATEFIGYAVEGTKRMNNMIQDILKYSQVSTQAKAHNMVNSETLLAEVLANLRVSIEENHAVVTHDRLPAVKAEKAQLGQVFQNLIGNAIKFQAKDREPRIHIGAERKDGEWLFSVRDNGIGIEPEYRDKIFSIFQRLHSREEYPGTGIGLAICKKIVELHGGRIWLESEPGKGSTFYFTLPEKK
jgi:PAS domain S-box-containing protein